MNLRDISLILNTSVEQFLSALVSLNFTFNKKAQIVKSNEFSIHLSGIKLVSQNFNKLYRFSLIITDETFSLQCAKLSSSTPIILSSLENASINIEKGNASTI